MHVDDITLLLMQDIEIDMACAPADSGARESSLEPRGDVRLACNPC